MIIPFEMLWPFLVSICSHLTKSGTDRVSSLKHRQDIMDLSGTDCLPIEVEYMSRWEDGVRTCMTRFQ